MTDVKLKPCPWCLSNDLKITEAMGEWWVNCNVCKASRNMKSTKEQAIEAWNTRTTPEAKNVDTMKRYVDKSQKEDWLGDQMSLAFRHGRKYKEANTKGDSLPNREENYPFWEWYKNIYLPKPVSLDDGFSVGDEVWYVSFIAEDQVFKGSVKEINYEISGANKCFKRKQKIYKTQAEAKAALDKIKEGE